MSLAVLIVDDNLGFRSIARRILESAGFQVIGEAGDGQGALAAVATLRPALVILDVGLPGASGTDVSRTISSQEGAPAVVLVSAREAADFGSVIDGCGARGFLPKRDLSGTSVLALLAATP